VVVGGVPTAGGVLPNIHSVLLPKKAAKESPERVISVEI
jgi:hypothetical protein